MQRQHYTNFLDNEQKGKIIRNNNIALINLETIYVVLKYIFLSVISWNSNKPQKAFLRTNDQNKLFKGNEYPSMRNVTM